MTVVAFAIGTAAQTNNPNNPTWWNKYQQLVTGDPVNSSPVVNQPAFTVGTNVDVSNECGPQSETYITLNPNAPTTLAAGSNEIFRLPMRGYFSSDGGATWGGVDLPLPQPIGTNGTRFGSDPTLAFDTLGNVFYGYIVVFFSNGRGASINGTEMAVARSSDGGRTYPNVTFFSFNGGESHFNDKPMITADTSTSSPFKDNVYIAWDAALGGSGSGGVRLARSTDHGATFSTTRIDNPTGPGHAIGAVPFTGPTGQVYVAWNDSSTNAIAFNRSLDGGITWGTPVIVAPKTIPFDIAIPAESFRGALVYPSCAADNSSGPHRGRLYCAWMDLTESHNTDIFVAHSDDQGSTWSAPIAVTDQLSSVDRFNQWLSVDPINGAVNVSFYDTRNDTTGFRYGTDIYLSQSSDGGDLLIEEEAEGTISAGAKMDRITPRERRDAAE
jgi:hypothetical protein